MNDDDLIRRGDALALIKASFDGAIGASDIAALPAVTVGVKPLRFFFAQGETVDQVREHARAHPLAKEGDMKLVWVNEGDLYDHSIFLAALEPVTPAPLTAEEIMDIITKTEVADQTASGDRRWIARMAEALAAKQYAPQPAPHCPRSSRRATNLLHKRRASCE